MNRRILGAFRVALEKHRSGDTEAAANVVLSTLAVPMMAVESLDQSTFNEIEDFVSDVKRAHNRLERLRGISLSHAMAYESLMPIPVNKENFSTHVGHRNYDLVMENLKGFLLIGASVALAGAIGYLAFKMIAASKKDVSKGKKAIETTKNLSKALELFSQIDLNSLTLDAKKKYLETARKAIGNELGEVTDDQLINEGWKIFCISEIYKRDPNYHYWIYLRGNEDSWIANKFVRAGKAFIEWADKTIDKLKVITKDSEDGGSVINEMLGGLIELFNNRASDLNASTNEYGFGTHSSPTINYATVEELLREPSKMPVRVILGFMDKEPALPKASVLDECDKLIKKFKPRGEDFKRVADKLDSEIEWLKEYDITNAMRNCVDELDVMIRLIEDENKIIATMSAARVAAAQEFSKAIKECLDEIIDPELKESITKKVGVAIKEIPRRIILEGFSEVISGNDDGLPEITYPSRLEYLPSDSEEIAYAKLPEYQQAGYRFYPQLGVDGANLMATESWSTGAKVAIGIAALVGVVGIGALIASTFVKKNATQLDRHASKENVDKIDEFFSVRRSREDSFKTRIRGLRDDFERSGLASTYPLLKTRIDELYAKIYKADSGSIIEDGVKYTPLHYALRNIPSHDKLSIGYIYSHGKTFLDESTLVSGKAVPGGSVSFRKTIEDFYEKVVVESIRDLEMGRNPEEVLQRIEKYDTRNIEWLQGLDLATVTGSIEMEWYDNHYTGMSSQWANDANGLFDALRSVYSRASKVIEQHKTIMDPFEMDERMVNRFKKLEEENRGSRNTISSILRRIEKFRPVFSLFSRAARYEQEIVEEFLTFSDNVVRSLTTFAKNEVATFKELTIEIEKLEKEVKELIKKK